MTDRQETIVALARRLGWNAEAVSQWRKKGRVPQECRWRLYVAACKDGLVLDDADFEGWVTTRGPRARQRPAAPSRAPAGEAAA
jgi:hypothetical protein